MTKKVLITGVAGGIGIETAKLFHAKGWEVIGTDIKEMEDALPINFIQGDISDKDNNKIIFNSINGDHPMGIGKSTHCPIKNAGWEIC